MSDIESTVVAEGALKRTLKISVPPAEVSAELDKAYGRLSRTARIRGFRKGKVPRKVLEREYGEEVQRDVLGSLIDRACGEAIREHTLDVVVRPRLVNHAFAPETGLRFEAEVEVRPQFELVGYKGLEVDRKIVRVDEAHIDAALGSLRERMALLDKVDDRVNVEPGDVVTFDMYGFVGDEPVPGTSGEGVQIEVGAGRFPEDFEKQMVGITRSIKTPIVVSFPSDHPDESLAGKTVRFDVTVREIKTKVLPTVDDDFVKELGWEDCDTLEQLRTRVREDLEAQAKRDADRRVRRALIERLVDAHSFEVPEALIEGTIARLAYEAGIQSVPKDKIEELRAALRPRALREVKAGFVLDAIAKAEQLNVSREEVEARVRQELAAAGDAADRVRKHYSEPGAVADLQIQLLRSKTLDRVVELSTQRDVQVEESEVADSR